MIPDETPEWRARESRRLCAASGPWRRWYAEPAPLAEDGNIPKTLDEESLERGRQRQRAIWKWIEEGGNYPWPD